MVVIGACRVRCLPLPRGPSFCFLVLSTFILDPSLERPRPSALTQVCGSRPLSNRADNRGAPGHRQSQRPDWFPGWAWWLSLLVVFSPIKRGAAPRGGWGLILSLKQSTFSTCKQIAGTMGFPINAHPIPGPARLSLMTWCWTNYSDSGSSNALPSAGSVSQSHGSVLNRKTWPERQLICAHLCSVSVHGESCQENKGRFHYIFLLFSARKTA